MNAEYIAFAAGILTTGSFIPQAIKVLKTKDTHSISLLMYIMFTAGVFLWLVYGIIVESPSISAANTVTFLLAALILAMKVRDG